MQNNIQPIFQTHASLGKSLLTLDKEDDISGDSTVSIVALAKKYKLPEVTILDDCFTLFIEAYKNLADITKLNYGINFQICADAKDLTDDSLKTQSKISVLMRNSDGYKDLIKLYSAAHTKETFYYTGRLDWRILKEKWTDNLMLILPFYDSFIHKNLLQNGGCVPDFSDTRPILTYAKMELPFDEILEENVRKYAQSTNFELAEVHPVCYYAREDFKAFSVRKAISLRSSFDRPNKDYFCSDEFCWESYCEKVGVEFQKYENQR